MKLAKEMGQPEKKAYVETTVISKFTVLPTYDSTLAGRQRAPDVLRFARRIKRETAVGHPTHKDHFKGILAYQGGAET